MAKLYAVPRDLIGEWQGVFVPTNEDIARYAREQSTPAAKTESPLAVLRICPFNVPTKRPGLHAVLGHELGLVKFSPGAFDATLRAVRSGDHSIELLIGHDRRAELASTEDGSLRVFAMADGLFATITRRGRGPAAARTLSLQNWRAVSPGYSPVEWRTETDAAGRKISTVTKAVLSEISIVGAANFPGTTLKLLA